MKPNMRFVYGIVLLLVLSGAVSAVRAEVSCEGDDAECALLILLGITEEPDPIFWESFDASELQDLNPDGEARGDGPPDFAIDASNAVPVAVWSYNLGTTSEIAFAEWSDQGWTATELLTADAVQDMSPFVTADPNGHLRVVWCRMVAGVETVWMIQREPGSDEWTDAQQITASGQRPSVVMVGMAVMIAYEREAAEGGSEVVLHTRGKGVTPKTQVIATTTREDRLDVEMHESHGSIWIDWKQSETQFGYVKYSADGEWGAEPVFVPWTDPSWVGVEFVRREIFVGL
jgi:hypothetical protein